MINSSTVVDTLSFEYTKAMNILYINGHPNPESFHAAIETTFVEALDSKHDIKVLSLGKETFDPVLRFGYAKRMEEDPFITASQEMVLWADHIVFTFPMWWGDAPSLLHGWIERVFMPGFAYHFKGAKVNRLLKGRTGDIIVTTRGIRPINWLMGNFGVMILLRNLFNLTGIRKKKILRLGGIGLFPITDNVERRKKFLAKVARRAATL